MERACPSTVSCADILTLAVREAIYLVRNSTMLHFYLKLVTTTYCRFSHSSCVSSNIFCVLFLRLEGLFGL